MTLSLPTGSRSALAIIDMQVFFFLKEERRKNLPTVVDNINRLIAHFEALNFPIYHVIFAFQADGSDWDLKMKSAGKPELIQGTPETAILPGINVKSKHTILVKTRYSAFFKTDFAERLSINNIQRLVVTGGYTHYCVNATIFDAFCHDFIPCLIADAVMSHLPEESEIMINRMRRNGYHVLSTTELLNGA
jgi:nicotinamidase-related amidase